MNENNFNKHTHKPRILIAPLDWGLGHATRCIPIIYELLEQDCEVVVAAENAIQSLLQNEFPQLVFIPLSGYRIQYSYKKFWLPLKIILQIPQLLYAIHKEHQWLKKAAKLNRIDAIISDNRFGLYSSSMPSVYITHQLKIKTGNTFTEKIAQKIHYWFIKKFSVCWVPDFNGNINIAGDLSHPKKLPEQIIYLGGFSRFKKNIDVEKKYDLTIIISGPEPQRTIFEDMLLDELKEYNGNVLFVRGLPAVKLLKQNFNSSIKIVNHLSSIELNLAIQQSNYVISRSGYTTIMDLIKLQQKAILIPTPGQTEQEYLAKHLAEQKIFFYAEQKKFSLSESLKKAEKFPFNIPEFNMEIYKNVIRQFVETLKK